MRIACIGGGPAGMRLAIALKRADRCHEVTVYERQRPGAQLGWGITISTELLDEMRLDEPELAERVAAHTVSWSGQRLSIRNEHAERQGRGAAIGRARFVEALTEHARSLGVDVVFEANTDPDLLRQEVDVVALCDGMNSAARTARVDAFGTRIAVGSNKYVWLGLSKRLEEFAFAFVRTPAGWIFLYGYPYDESRGTCVVECNEDTWHALGFADQPADVALRQLEELFGTFIGGSAFLPTDPAAPELAWLNFKTITNERWHVDNLVLVGDAAHTAHYSIGCGTKLALGDATALAQALVSHGPTPIAFDEYQSKRRSETRAIQALARHSAHYFENIDRYASLRADLLLSSLRARRHGWLQHAPAPVHARLAGLRAALRSGH